MGSSGPGYHTWIDSPWIGEPHSACKGSSGWIRPRAWCIPLSKPSSFRINSRTSVPSQESLFLVKSYKGQAMIEKSGKRFLQSSSNKRHNQVHLCAVFYLLWPPVAILLQLGLLLWGPLWVCTGLYWAPGQGWDTVTDSWTGGSKENGVGGRAPYHLHWTWSAPSQAHCCCFEPVIIFSVFLRLKKTQTYKNWFGMFQALMSARKYS